MAKYQAYPEYKDSGNKWLDMIPVNWKVISLKHVLSMPITDGPHSTPEFIDEGVPFVSAEAVSSGCINFNKIRGFISEADNNFFSQKYRPQRNDVYMVKSGATTGITAIVETDQHFNIWSPLAVMRCKNTYNPYFLLNYLRSEPFQKSVQLSWTFGTQQNIGMGVLENLAVCCPPLEEQQKIANFLDHETAKIDTLIEKQQQLITLLKEKRQAVISHAVTKGLNANAPMRDSGVEWLGEVPKHWDVVKLSYRYKVLLGKMLDDKKITGDYLGSYLRNTDVQWDRINTDGLPKMDFRPEEHQRYSVSKGDLIVCEGGEIGRCAIWEKEAQCFYQKALHRLRPLDKDNDETRFMFYVLFDAVHQERFSGGVAKATIAHLPAETFRQYKFAYPPYEEQLKISTFLDDIKDKFEAIELSAENQIDLLQERRTALISAAVTGKIDVRTWQAPEENKNKDVA